VAKSEVTCEVKEAFLGFDDVMTDKPLLHVFMLFFLFPFILACLFHMASSQYYFVSL